MLNFIEEWCNKWRMAVNIDKTQVFHFCRLLTERTTCTFSLGNKSLKIVSCYKYLGVIFDEHLSFDQNASVLTDCAGRVLGTIRTKLKYVKEWGYTTFNTLFKSGVWSIADYSAGIWGMKIFSTIEQVQPDIFLQWTDKHKRKLSREIWGGQLPELDTDCWF